MYTTDKTTPLHKFAEEVLPVHLSIIHTAAADPLKGKLQRDGTLGVFIAIKVKQTDPDLTGFALFLFIPLILQHMFSSKPNNQSVVDFFFTQIWKQSLFFDQII